MTKLCDKCHKNTAVVHVRAILLNGKHETSSYCLPCALALIEGDNPPPGLKEMLEGIKKEFASLKLPGMEDFKNLQEGGGGDSHAETSEQPSMPKTPGGVTCPHCHNEWGREPIDEHILKCGHCISVARKQFREKFGVGFENRFDLSTEAQGLPVICGEKHKENRKRLLKLLKCYHESLEDNREEGAELLRQEIIGLRQEMTETIRESNKSFRDSSSYSETILHGAQGVTSDNTYDGLLRHGWLPLPDEEDAQICLSHGVLARRSMVDLPMKDGATAKDYSGEVLSRLMAEPVFKGGFVNRKDDFLLSANKRIFAKCGGSGLDGHRAGHFEMGFLDRITPNGRMVEWLDDLLRRVECRNTLFADPEFGYFHPERNSGGSGMTIMEFLHLPALCANVGLPRLRKIVGAMDGGNCLRGRQGIRLEAPYGWSKMGLASYMTSLGGFLVLEDTRMFGVSLHERYITLRRIASRLEKQERAMRRRMRTDSLRREEILDDMTRSYSLLRYCRQIGSEDALSALSKLWLGKELGCFPSLAKNRLIDAVKVSATSDDILYGDLPKENFKLERLGDMPPKELTTEYLPDVLWEDQDLDVAMVNDDDRMGGSPVEIFNELPCNVEDFCETLNESLLNKPMASSSERRRNMVVGMRRALVIKKLLFKDEQ